MICVADEKIVLIPVTRAMLIIIAARDRPGWTRSAADQRGEKGDRDEHGQYATQYEPECVALRLTRVLPVSHRGRGTPPGRKRTQRCGWIALRRYYDHTTPAPPQDLQVRQEPGSLVLTVSPQTNTNTLAAHSHGERCRQAFPSPC
jgi:hypothetical protein